MPKCAFCEIHFPLLDGSNDATIRCGKCSLRKPGLSVPEIAMINEKPQCVGCGLASDVIQNPLCNKCIQTYKQASDVPMRILAMPGVAGLLLDRDVGLSDDAANVISSAQAFQARASDKRINKPSTAQGTSGGINRLKNLSKAQAVVAERKAKREEAKLAGGVGIKIGATLWKIQGFGKMTKIEPNRVTNVFGPDVETKTALGELLKSIRKPFSEDHPEAEILTWSNVKVYAHETQQKFCLLNEFDYSQPVERFFQEFVTKQLAAASMLKDKKIEIRFVFNEEKVFNYDYDEPSSYQSSSRTRAPKSSFPAPQAKKARMEDKRTESRASVQPAPVTGNSAMSAALDKSGAPPILPSAFRSAPQPKGPVMKSAFKASFAVKDPAPTPIAKWTQDIEVTTNVFERTTGTYNPQDGLKVKLNTAKELEEIQIASNWENEGDDGFIGKGASKCGIYAHYNNKEYVLTQPIERKQHADDVAHILCAEYGLLCIGHRLKEEFDKYAQESGITTIPKFYFNFKDSFIGSLVPDTTGGRNLPHTTFMATPLLPCGELDANIKKFTGNMEFGTVSRDEHLMMAVHAFTHFMAVYTEKNIVLCDLQGLCDHDGVMCLIDPQAHTAQPASSHEFWDGGSKKMEKFLALHMADCHKNWICNALKLKEVRVHQVSSSSASRTV